MHFTTLSYAQTEATCPASEVTNMVYDPKYATINYNPYNKFLSCALIYSGFKMSDIETAISKLRASNFS